MRLAFLIGMIVAVVELAGCANAPVDDGKIQKNIQERTGASVRWNKGGEADHAVDSEIDRMLEHEVTVDQAVQIALLNNHSVQVEYAKVGVAQADLVAAGLLKNPMFNTSLRYPTQGSGGPNVEFSVTQEFIDLLMIPMRKKIARTQLEQTQLEVAGAVVGLAGDVRGRYWALVGATEMLAMREATVEAMRVSAETSKRLHDAGNINDLNLETVTATYEVAQADLDSARAESEQDREELVAVMGLSGEQAKFAVVKQLPELPWDLSVDELEKVAQEQRLDLAAAKKAEVTAVRSRQALVGAPFFPGLQIGGDTERDPAGGRVSGPVFSLPIPLFDQGQADLMRADAELMAAHEKEKALARQIESDVRKSNAMMAAQRARAMRYRDVIVPLRKKIVDAAQLHYNGMLIDVFQLLQFKQNEIDARRDYIAALRDYWMARAKLERDVGGKLPETIAATQPVK